MKTLVFLATFFAVNANAVLLLPTQIATSNGYRSESFVRVLHDREMIGEDDDFEAYIEFTPDKERYSGTITFKVPPHIDLQQTANFVIRANYRGPDSHEQKWILKIRDFTTGTWVPVLDNQKARSWEWTRLQEEVYRPLTDYVTASREIVLQYSSPTAVDVSQLDYLVIELPGIFPVNSPKKKGN